MLGVPLGIFFVVFSVDLTDILKGSFLEILISSVSLLKKFFIFAIIILLSLILYILSLIAFWIYIFAGTLGIMNAYLQEGSIFSLKDFSKYGRKFFWKVGLFSLFSGLVFLLCASLLVMLGELNSYFIQIIEQYSHAFSTFINVFIYLVILTASILSFLVWITYTLFGLFGFFVKDFSLKEAIVETKRFIVAYPQSIGRAGLLFVIYILTGGFLLSLGSLFAILPHIGTALAAVYQFFVQFAQIYISLVVLAAFMSYYIRLNKDISSQQVPEQEQILQKTEAQPQEQNLPPSEPV
ncbi:hypothetical protein [Thermodesulfovibrio hydrogeniphilus]